MTLAAVAAVLSIVLRSTVSASLHGVLRHAVCWAIALLALASFAFEQTYELATGHWSVRDSLPLHICDLGIFVTAAALFSAARDPARFRRWTRPQLLYEVAYYWGLAGTTQALLTPDLPQRCPDPLWFRYFIGHGSIVLGVLVLTFGLGIRPRPGGWQRVWLLTLALALAVLVINRLIGANYMYLCARPQNPTIIDYLGRWPWYLLPLVGLATVLMWILYAPWWLLDRVRRGRRTTCNGGV